MPPGHVGVRGSFPAPPQSCAEGGPQGCCRERVVPLEQNRSKAWCSGDSTHVPKALRDPQPVLPSAHQNQLTAPQLQTRCKDAEFGERIDPVGGARHPRSCKKKIQIYHYRPQPPANRAAPGAPAGGFWGELHPAGLSPAGLGDGSACFGSWTGARAGWWQLILGHRRAAPAPAHSVPASAGTAASFVCHPPAWHSRAGPPPVTPTGGQHGHRAGTERPMVTGGYGGERAAPRVRQKGAVGP